ncbi:MAG: PilZ domain-containing protein [Thiohalorhabdaceae bacterium]
MDEGHDHRRYSRVKWGDWASISTQQGSTEGRVLDISLNGVLVAAELPLDPGEACEVRIPLGDDPEQTIVAEGRVVRRDESGLAIHFEAMELDSAAHLRNLVTYNSDDPGRIEREAIHLRLSPEQGDEPSTE